MFGCGSSGPRRTTFTAFHAGLKRNEDGEGPNCANAGCPFTVAASERGVPSLPRRSFQSNTVRPDGPAQVVSSPVVQSTTFHSPQSYPTINASSVRERIPSLSTSRPNTTSTPFDGVVFISMRMEKIRASCLGASNTQFVTTSQSSCSGTGIVGTTSAVASIGIATVTM